MTTHDSSTSSSSSSSPNISPTRTDVITLADGRTMHYSMGGNMSSRRIVLMLHGVFGVGDVSPSLSYWYNQRDWCCLAPTLPGWGISSPFPKNTPVSAYVDDIRQLLDAVMQQTPTDIIIFGGSYGSVWAYAVAANAPPTSITTTSSDSDSRTLTGLPPSSIRGLFIMGGFSPFRVHSNYSSGMSWLNYLTVGYLGLYRPFSWLHGMLGRMLRSKMANNIDGSLGILRMILTGEKVMTQQERQHITTWAQQIQGLTFQQWELTMAKNMSQSIAQTLDGYDRVCETLNSDWGFQLQDIHVATSSATTSPLSPLRIPFGSVVPSILPPIIICGALRDHLAPIPMMQWVATQIPGAQLIELDGNHISGITSLLSIMDGMIKGIHATQSQQS